MGSDKLMKELDKGLEVTHRQIGPDQKRCSVLPGVSPFQASRPPTNAVCRQG